MKQEFGRKIVKALDSFIQTAILIFYVFFLIFGIYTIWDGRQVSAVAHSNTYQVYKPDGKSNLPLSELSAINDDVFGWLTIYGTGIDYPIVQGDDNDKYVSTNVQNQYTMSGSIFLDYRNSLNFDDFNSIFYGHHMADSVMFGDLSQFSERNYFDKHLYGNLHFNQHDYGLELFAFLEVDANDARFFSPAISGEINQTAFTNHIKDNALYYRPVDISIDDQFIVLTTCTTSSTNGRHILIARLNNRPYEIPEEFKEQYKGEPTMNQDSIYSIFSNLPRFMVVIASAYLIILFALIIITNYQKRRRVT